LLILISNWYFLISGYFSTKHRETQSRETTIVKLKIFFIPKIPFLKMAFAYQLIIFFLFI